MKVKPLSSINYLKNNKKKTITTIICVALCVFFIYVFSMYVQANFMINDYTTLNILERCSIIYSSKDSQKINNDLIDKVSKEDSTEKVVQCGLDFTNFNMPLGGDMYLRIYKIRKEDIRFIVGKMKLKLKEGKLPENNKEIVLDYRLAKSKGLQVGDNISEDLKKKEVRGGGYKITGTLAGDGITGFIPVEKPENERFNALIVFHKSDQVKESNEYINKSIKEKNIGVITLQKALNSSKNEKSQMKIIFNITQIIVVIVMTLAIVNLSYVHFFHRRKEFGTLHALGYSRRMIVFRVFKEILFLQSVGYLLGIVLALITGYILKISLFYRKGLPLEVLNYQSFIQTMIIPIFMCIFNIIPVWRMLKNIDSISIVEGNE